MNIEHGIDWLSVTAKRDKGSIRNPRNILPYLADEFFTESVAKLGYTSARKFIDTGVLEMSNEARPDMGVHTIYSGKALARLADQAGITAYDVLNWHVTQGHTIARIDVKIDARDTGINLEALYNEKGVGTLKTQAKSVSFIETQNASGYAGSTLYVGSLKKRKKLLRIYDKAAELGTLIDGVLADHKRIEFEVHGKPATSLAREMSVSQWQAPQVIGSAIRGYADFSDEIWQALFSDCSAWKIGSASAQDKHNDTAQWLLKQCAPALAKQIAANPEFMGIFFGKVSEELKELGVIDNG